MNNLLPGTVVSVMAGPFEHYGIVSDQQTGGMPCIISNSRRTGQVSEESAWDFADGKTIQIRGYPSKLNSATVLTRARSRLGKAYSLWRWNCEHFVKWAHGLRPESLQLQTAGLIALSLFSIYYLTRNR